LSDRIITVSYLLSFRSLNPSYNIMNNIFTISYWFNMNPGSLAPKFLIAFVVFLLVMFVAIFVLMVLKKKQSGAFYKIYDRLQSFAIGNLVIGLLYLFFTSQLVPVLSSRFWFLLWALGMGVWLWFISRDIAKIPEMRKKKAEAEEFQKYIP
jgi:hypothetical protein